MVVPSRAGGRGPATSDALVRRVLLAVARRDPDSLSELVRRPLPGLVEAASAHRMSGLVYAALQQAEEADAGLVSSFRTAALAAAGEHLRVLVDLREVLDWLERRAIPALVLKGPVLAERLYDDPWHRSYLDLDVLVPPRDFREVLDSLGEVGGELCNRNWVLLQREMKSEVSARLRMGTMLDLHWHPIADARIRSQTRLPLAQLFADPRRVEVGGALVPTLDPAATVVYLAAHACWSGAHHLVWHVDLRNAIEREGASWGAIVDCARSWAVEAPVAFTLQRMSQLLAVDLPPEARTLARAAAPWQSLGAAVGRRSTLQVGEGRYQLHQLAARATRNSTLRSTGALVGQLVDYAARGGPARVRSRDRGLDPEHPSSIYFDAPSGREAYLAAVTSTPLQPTSH